jgi:DNA-directed RNA polymerase
VTPTLAEIEAQIRWECHAVEEGVRSYRRARQTGPLILLPPGQAFMRDALPRLEAAIERYRAATPTTLRPSRGNPQDRDANDILLALPADVLAYITLASVAGSFAARKVHLEGTAMATLTNVALSVSRAVRLQIEFEAWKAREQQETRVARAEGRDRTNLFEALKRNTKVIDAKAWTTWARKIGHSLSAPWPSSFGVRLGSALLHLAATEGGGWVEIATVWKDGKSIRLVGMPPHAREALDNIDARAELNAYRKLPTICPPKPWRWEASAHEPQQQQ